MRPCRYNVKITRWDVYRVNHIVEASPAEAEERAIEIFEDDTDSCDHVEGGLNFVEAEPDEDC